MKAIYLSIFTTVFLFLNNNPVLAVNNQLLKFTQYVNEIFVLDTPTLEAEGALYYFIKGKYNRPITLEKLHAANDLSDIIAYYPSKWIATYTAVELSVPNQKVVLGKDEVLTAAQKEVILGLNHNDIIQIKIKYESFNAVNKERMASEMNYQLTVVPAVEAAYLLGADKLEAELKAKSLLKIEHQQLAAVKNAVINFTVNELGGIENVELITTSGNLAIDLLMVDLIASMPTWVPAKDAQGNAVKQDFQFLMGNFSELGC